VPVPPPTEAPPAQPAPQPSGGQVVLSSPSSEFRLGGGPYTIPVSITGVSRASTVSISIAFNPQVVRVRSVQEGSFMRQGGVNVAFQQRVDAAAGRIDITLTRTSDTTGASGAGLLAALLVEPAGEGNATLSASGIATTPQGAPLPLTFVPVSVTVR
jgi:general secretion pathway protein D